MLSTNTRQINHFAPLFVAITKRRNDHFKPFLRIYIYYNVFVYETRNHGFMRSVRPLRQIYDKLPAPDRVLRLLSPMFLRHARLPAGSILCNKSILTMPGKWSVYLFFKRLKTLFHPALKPILSCNPCTVVLPDKLPDLIVSPAAVNQSTHQTFHRLHSS